MDEEEYHDKTPASENQSGKNKNDEANNAKALTNSKPVKFDMTTIRENNFREDRSKIPVISEVIHFYALILNLLDSNEARV